MSTPSRSIWLRNLDFAVSVTPTLPVAMVTKQGGFINNGRSGEEGERALLPPPCPPMLRLPNAITRKCTVDTATKVLNVTIMVKKNFSL